MLWLRLQLKSMLIRHIVWRCVVSRMLKMTEFRFMKVFVFSPQTAAFSFVTRVSLLNLKIIINSHKSLKSFFLDLDVLLSNKNMLVCWLQLCVRVGVWVCDVVIIGNLDHVAAVRGQLRHSNLSSYCTICLLFRITKLQPDYPFV